MPMFEYKCRKCGHVTEFLEERDSKSEHRCEACTSPETVKMLSTFGVRVKAPSVPACDRSCASGTCPYA